MRLRQSTNLLVLASLLSGCSAFTQTSTVPSTSSIPQAISSTMNVVAPLTRRHPIIYPSFLFFGTRFGSFEVYGRWKWNQHRWKTMTSCGTSIQITFAGFNSNGSQYNVYVNFGGTSCSFTATTPYGKQGTIVLYASTTTGG